MQALPGRVPLGIAPQMGRHAAELRQPVQKPRKSSGGREVLALIPGVEQYGQAPPMGGAVEGHELRVVYPKFLEIRVQLYSPKPPALYIVQLPLYVLYILVPGPKPHELRVPFALALDKAVYRAHLLHLGRHRTDREPVYPGPSPLLQQDRGQAHIVHVQIVESPHRGRGLLGYLLRVYMGVGVRRPVLCAIMDHRQAYHPFPLLSCPAPFWSTRTHSSPAYIGRTPSTAL